MASFISDSIFTALKLQFEDAMRTLVQKIAEGEGLDEAELMTKYLVNVIPAKETKKAKVPTKPRKEAKVTVTPAADECAKCSCMTAKGKPCALKPLSGTTMCRIHTKKAESEGASGGPSTGPIKDPKPKKETKPKKTKKVKADAPVHTHVLDDEDHDDCELCQSHGNPLHETEDEFETVSSPRRSLRDRLMRAADEEEFIDDDEI